MFTGLVAGVGNVVSIDPIGDGHDCRVSIAAPAGFLDAAATGASIACSGCCLTAVELAEGRFAVDASAETLALTTLGAWRLGTRVNLERSLRMGDELGGHLVSGHVDGVGHLRDVTADEFDVNIIPHTAAATTLGALDAGDAVNIEVDMLARYVARILSA